MTSHKLEDLERWIAAAIRLVQEASLDLPAATVPGARSRDGTAQLWEDMADVEMRLRKIHTNLQKRIRDHRPIGLH